MTGFESKQNHPISDARKINELTQTVVNCQIMNRALEMISVETDFDKSVNHLLALIGEELHANRCYVIQFTDNGTYSDNTHEWTSRPELAEIQNLQHVPTRGGLWYQALEKGKTVAIPDMDHPPEEYNDIVELLRRQHIKSIFFVGLREEGRLTGFIGVDFVDRRNEYSESMFQILENAVKLYDIVCERSRSLRIIEEKNNEIRDRESLQSLIINAIPAHIFAKDADDHFRYMITNRKFAEFVGKPVEEIIGKTDQDLFDHTEDWEWFENRDKEIMESGESRNFPESAFNAKGERMHFQTVKTPCVGLAGKRLLLGVSVDISRNANLNRSREIIRQCLETLVLDPNLEEGISRSISQVREYIKADRIYLYRFDFKRRKGEFYKEFHAPESKALFETDTDVPFSTSLDWEKYFRRECFLNFPDIQNEAILDKFGPYYKQIIRKQDARSLYCHRLLIEGKLWGYVGIVFEKKMRVLAPDELDFVQSTARFVEIMIQHEQMQSELLQALKEAKAAEKAKSYFLATMSHEIRTPLNAVIGFSEILKDDTLPPATQKNYLNDISVAGNALLALINDVLDLSKLEAGQMTFTPTETDFSALVNEVATIFQQRFRDKKLENIIRIDSMPTLLLDKLRMRQILFNLVGNAVKFTEQGKIEFSADFTPTGDSSGTLRFSLADTGCGISSDDQKRLFQPFVQSHAIRGTQAEKNGTGLGLAIIRRMLERLNGSIQLQSELGKGSTFTVTIHGVEYLVKRHVQSKLDEKVPPPAQEFSGCVLVVDDVVMNLKVTQAMLEKIGVASLTANGSEAAMECLRQNDVTLILCDLWMPGMNGDELARKIRKTYPERSLKIIALTADTESGGTFDMNEFDGVLHKPINLNALRKVISC